MFKDDLSLFSFENKRNSNILRVWFNFRSEMEFDLVIQYADL